MVLILDEFEAWVTIDGQKVEEYQCTKMGSVLQCFIPSEAGKTFQVHWKDNKRITATDGFLIIDGLKCQGKTISDAPDKPNYACKTGLRTDGTTIKPFKFSQVRFTDDDTRADPELSSNTELGYIDLMLFRVRIKHNEEYVSRTAPKPQVLHERAKKGIQHQTVFGKSIKDSTPKKAVRLQQLSPDAIARFRFFYRPIDMLRAKGIAPPVEELLSRQPETNPCNAPVALKQTGTEEDTFDTRPKPVIPETTSQPSCPEPLRQRGISLPAWESLSPVKDVKEEEDEIEEAEDIEQEQLCITSVPSCLTTPLKREPDEQSLPPSSKQVAGQHRDRQLNHNVRTAGASAMNPIVIDEDEDMEVLTSLPSPSSVSSQTNVCLVTEGKTPGSGNGYSSIAPSLIRAMRHNKKRKRSPFPPMPISDSTAKLRYAADTAQLTPVDLDAVAAEKDTPSLLSKRHKIHGTSSDSLHLATTTAGSASIVSTRMDEVIDLDKEGDLEEDQATLMEIEALRVKLGMLEAKHNECQQARELRKQRKAILEEDSGSGEDRMKKETIDLTWL